MNDWSPHILKHCMDSSLLAWLTVILASAVVLYYVIIAWFWWRAARHSTARARQTWGWLVIVFVACGVAGYGAFAFALDSPKTAILLRLFMLVVLNIACPIFIGFARQKEFRCFGEAERIGSHFVGKDLSKMSNDEVVRLANTATCESIKRRVATKSRDTNGNH